MASPDFTQNYFELFGIPVGFTVDNAFLGRRYRELQGEFHPDRFAGKSDQEQRVAVQYSSLVNQAHSTLRRPLSRALYLLELTGQSAEQVSRQQVDGGFLVMQMELREKLESVAELVDPEPVLEHLLSEIHDDQQALQAEFARAYGEGKYEDAASACVKMQYLDKLQREAEQVESDLMD